MGRSQFRLVAKLALLAIIGCTTAKATRPYIEPPPPNIDPTVIEYAETEAFDALLESALTNQDPVIVIQTDRAKPDWGGHLNAWIAAWNMGGRVEQSGERRKVRMQSPVVINEGSIREFRLLVEGLMGRVEDSARERSAWWAEEKIKARRVELLKPYNMRFHMDHDGHIEIILFNGNYKQHFPNFMKDIAGEEADNSDEWSREYGCSRGRKLCRAE